MRALDSRTSKPRKLDRAGDPRKLDRTAAGPRKLDRAGPRKLDATRA